MFETLTPAPLIQKGEVYKIDPLIIHTKCKKCEKSFVHHYKIDFRVICPKCKNSSDPDRVQRGYRPMLIVQDPSYTESSNTVTVVPITSSSKRLEQLPGIVVINRHINLKLEGLFNFALLYQIRTVNKNSIFKENHCGRASDSDLSEINKKLKSYFAL